MTINRKSEQEAIEFNLEGMIEFYERFDPVWFKYKEQLKKLEEKGKERYFLYSRFMSYDDSHYLSTITKMDYARLRANGELVYGDVEKFNDYVKLIQLISDKIIGRLLLIDGVERLFSEFYIDFEWQMHLDVDYTKHGFKFYRDHYIHQIRDAYMMHRMMCDENGEDTDLYETVKFRMLYEEDSKVSKYVTKMIQKQLLTEDYFLRDNIETNEKTDYYVRNIIFLSSYMAALFHDIGYPESFYKAATDHIKNYLPEVWALNGGGSDIGMIQSMLSNSLLFRVVPAEEIAARLMDYKEFKYDHGAYSAAIFLMHFYENGTIYSLEPYKAAAVEIAGLAIYNHTNKYEVIDDKNTVGSRPMFYENPLSYLLRVCDDLQEWDRLYFLVTKASNIVLCDRCKSPLVRRRKNNKDVYECNCERINGTKTVFSKAFEGENRFVMRRLYNLQVCDKVRVEYPGDNSKDPYVIRLDYNLHKLLHTSFINPDFAKYRIDELNKLKMVLKSQDGFPVMLLRYFVTSNPILIKSRILYEYTLKNWGGKIRKNISLTAYCKKIYELIDSFMEEACRIDESGSEKPGEFQKILKEYYEGVLYIYASLAYMMHLTEENDTRIEGREDEYIRNLTEHTALSGGYEAVVLVKDAVKQIRRFAVKYDSFNDFPDHYYHQFEADSLHYYVAQKRFVSREAYQPLLAEERENRCIDAFTDLYLFKLIAEARRG